MESEQQLRNLPITDLASKSREAWNRVKTQLPSNVRTEIESHFNVLTDPTYIEQQAKTMAGTSR